MNAVLDNPLYEGLGLVEQFELLETWPPNWRANYLTWQPKTLMPKWPSPHVGGNVRRFNDYPCINNTRPAFSQRAVDLLRDILEPNGELLPVHHNIGTYYFYNCTNMNNCVDLSKSEVTKLKDGLITSVNRLSFIDEMVENLTIFKVRTQLIELFCTQTFVDRVEAAGLQGFMFVPIWPLPQGVTFRDEDYRMGKIAEKWKPQDVSQLDIKGNTVVIRLYCERKKPTKVDHSNADYVMDTLEKVLYNPDQNALESYYGNVEGLDQVDYEIRVFLSAPDCDRLVSYLEPTLKLLPWSGKFHVVKRRSEFDDERASEEYVRFWGKT